jgi:polar amino acid transport system substrate-binding protein
MKNTNKLLAGLLATGLLLTTGCSSATGSTAATSTSSGITQEQLDAANPDNLDTSSLEKPDLDLSNPTGELKTILDNGVLKVATSPDFPAAEWQDDTGTVYGYEMMIAKYIADCLGVDFQIETSDFSGTFVAVDTGKVDVAFSGYGWKKDRAENYELSNGWIADPTSEESKHTLITTKENEGKFNSLSDFVGKRIMAQANSLQEMYVEDEILALDTDGTTTYESVGTLDQAILGLSSGKCDAVALANNSAENYVASSDGQFVLTEVYFDLTPYGDYQGNVCLAKKGETQLMEVINECLATATDNGYISEWYQIAKTASGVE